MKNKSVHIVQQQRYEITLEREEEAYAFQSRISRMQDKHISALTNDILDKYHSVAYHDVFDAVTLDLGKISLYNFDEEFKERLETALNEFMSKEYLSGNRPQSARRRGIGSSGLEQLIFFLQYGFLKWSTPGQWDLNIALKEILENNGDEFIIFLNNNKARKSVLQRLLTHIDELNFKELVLLTTTGSGKGIYQMYQRMRYSEKLQKLSGIVSGAFNYRISEITLVFLLNNPLTDEFTYIRHMAESYAKKYDIAFRDVLEGLRTSEKNQSQSYIKKLLVDEKRDDEFLASQEMESDDFPSVFRYYLHNGSLPNTMPVKAQNAFLARVEQEIVKNSKEFSEEIGKIMNDARLLELLSKRIPEHLLNTLLTSYTNVKLKTVTRYLNLLKASKINDLTLIRKLRQEENRIILQIYTQTLKGTGVLKAFIDFFAANTKWTLAFEKALSEIQSEFEPPEKKVITEYLSEKQRERRSQSEELYKTLFNRVNRNTQLTFKQFISQTGHLPNDLVGASLRFMERTRKEKVNIPEWIKTQHKIFKIKDRNRKGFSADVVYILRLLGGAEALTTEILKVTEQGDDLYLSAAEVEVELLNKLKMMILKAASDKLKTAEIKTQIEKMISKVRLDKKNVWEALERSIASETESDALYEAFDKIRGSKNKDKTHLNPNYKRDLVLYFCKYGALPWWGKNESLKTLNTFLLDVLQDDPKPFMEIYKKSDHKIQVLGMMDATGFNLFLKHLGTSQNANLQEIVKCFEQVLFDNISKIRRIKRSDIAEFRLLIATEQLSTRSSSATEICEDLIKLFSRVFKIETYEIEIMLYESQKQVKLEVYPVKNEGGGRKEQISDMHMELEMIFKGYGDQDHETFLKLIEIINNKSEALQSWLKTLSNRKRLLDRLSEKQLMTFIMLITPKMRHAVLRLTHQLFYKITREDKIHSVQSQVKKFIENSLVKIVFDNQSLWTYEEIAVLLQATFSAKTFQRLQKQQEFVNKLSEDEVEIIKYAALSEKVLEIKNEPQEFEKDDIPLEIDTSEAIYIHNAGLVILGPYIPILMERMKLTENGRFNSKENAAKGAVLLQYAVTGADGFAEYDLVLNKILCGIPIEEPLHMGIVIKPEEKELVDGLLQAIIQQWSILKNTSVQGLREAFLIREGRLTFEDDGYVLTIQEKTYDMLLDHIPWNIRKLKFSWMKNLLETLWRS